MYLKHDTLFQNMTTNSKTPFTYFYCDETSGMRLRSGTTINNIKNSPFFKDLKNFYYNMPIEPIYEEEIVAFIYNYANDCFSVTNLIRFLEKNHEALRTDPSLVNHYKEQLNNINSQIDMIEQGKVKCNCWHYFSWRVTDGACMLTEEYDYLQSADHAVYHSIKHIKNNNHPDFYRNRTLHRLHHTNFLIPTEQTDTDGIQAKKHDFTQILDELKLWQRYFNKEHLTRVKVASQVLNKITIQDCAGKILEFL